VSGDSGNSTALDVGIEGDLRRLLSTAAGSDELSDDYMQLFQPLPARGNTTLNSLDAFANDVVDGTSFGLAAIEHFPLNTEQGELDNNIMLDEIICASDIVEQLCNN